MNMVSSPPKTDATGSIARASAVLKAIAAAGDGAALAAVVEHTGFSKTTAHRILTSLQEVRFVAQDPLTKRWYLGSTLAALARLANSTDIATLARPLMGRLADLSEDTIYLTGLEGSDGICLARRAGAFPIRTLALDRGDSRPLGVGAGCLAIFSALPDQQRTAACKINSQRLADYNLDPAKLEAMRIKTLKRGYAYVRGTIVRGMSAISMPVHVAGRVVAALSIAAIDERMTEERVTTVLAPALKAEVQRLAVLINQTEDHL